MAQEVVLTDLDDTLLKTSAKIKKTADGKYDFSEFDESHRFLTADFNYDVLQSLKDAQERGARIGVITARGSGAPGAGDEQSVYDYLDQTFAPWGLHFDRSLVFAITDPKHEWRSPGRDEKGRVKVDERKASVIQELQSQGVDNITYYDDQTKNIEAMSGLGINTRLVAAWTRPNETVDDLTGKDEPLHSPSEWESKIGKENTRRLAELTEAWVQSPSRMTAGQRAALTGFDTLIKRQFNEPLYRNEMKTRGAFRPGQTIRFDWQSFTTDKKFMYPAGHEVEFKMAPSAGGQFFDIRAMNPMESEVLVNGNFKVLKVEKATDAVWDTTTVYITPDVK